MLPCRVHVSLCASAGDWTTVNPSQASASRKIAAVELHGVTAGYPGGGDALRCVTLAVRPGELCAVLGPNGAGKSTLVRLLSGALRPRVGAVTLLGDDLLSLDRPAIARRIAVVPQAVEVALGFSVEEVVMMGRAP